MGRHNSSLSDPTGPRGPQRPRCDPDCPASLALPPINTFPRWTEAGKSHLISEKNTAAKKSTRTPLHLQQEHPSTTTPQACRSYTENFQKVGDTPSLYRDPGPKRTLSCAL